MRQPESALAGGPLQQQVANRQDALMVSKVGDPFIKRVKIAGIAQRKCREQLKVAQIARCFQLDELFESSMRPHTLVMLRGVVVDKLFLEFSERGVEFRSTVSAHQIVWRIQNEQQLFSRSFNRWVLRAFRSQQVLSSSQTVFHPLNEVGELHEVA